MGHIDVDQDRKKECVFKIEIGGNYDFRNFGEGNSLLIVIVEVTNNP